MLLPAAILAGSCLVTAAGGPAGPPGAPAAAPATPAALPAEPVAAVRLLEPIPDHGAVPPIVAPLERTAEEQEDWQRRSDEFRRRIRRTRHDCLGTIRAEARRSEGIHQLLEMRDPAAMQPLLDELAGESADVRLAVLDHLATMGDDGQGALARVAVYDPDEAVRFEAVRRMTAPATDPVLRVLDEGLRSNTHAIANQAGALAGALRAVETIPLLIFAQATADPVGTERGDIAWIAIETQKAFVAALQPVVGSGAAAFQPIPGVVTSGAVLRVVDAVAIFYRTEVHRALVSMTTDDWGQPTEALAYDMRAWWHWYNEQYLPFKNRKALESQLAGQAARS